MILHHILHIYIFTSVGIELYKQSILGFLGSIFLTSFDLQVAAANKAFALWCHGGDGIATWGSPKRGSDFARAGLRQVGTVQILSFSSIVHVFWDAHFVNKYIYICINNNI